MPILVVGSNQAWIFPRYSVEAVVVQSADLEASRKELSECQARTVTPPPPKGFWHSGPGVAIKVGGISLVIGVAFVGGVELGVHLIGAAK